MALFSRNLGIDLGTDRVRIAEGDQVLLDEPTLVAVAVAERRMVAAGAEAAEMEGRAPDVYEVIRPLQNGVVAYYELTEKLLHILLRKAGGASWLFRPKVMITVPYGVTSVERRAVHEAALQAGSSEVYLLPTPLASALGADLPVGSPAGNMIVNIGSGTTQAAVVAMYGVVSAETLRKGGRALDEALVTYVRRKYGLVVGQPTAEQVKIKIGAAVPLDEEMSTEVQGQDQVTGLPREITLTTSEVVEALEAPLSEMVEAVRLAMEKTPPELAADVIDRGIALCGGSALLRGFDRLMTKELGVPAYLVDNPQMAAVLGAARGLEQFAILRRHLVPL